MDLTPQKDLSYKPARMDFVLEKSEVDKETGMVYAVSRLDPRRYRESVTKDGERMYVDKYTRVGFTLEQVAAAMNPGVPVYELSPAIESSRKYAAERSSALEEELHGGEYIPPPEKPDEHRALLASDDHKQVAFLSVDIAGSTVLRQKSAERFDKSYGIFVRELATVVGQFRGSILKLTGDGFIAFVDHPAFTRLCDMTVDMGLSLLQVLHEGINPKLEEAGLPKFSVRIGADYGWVRIREITIPATSYQSTEVASDALNRAVKIQEACNVDEFRIGQCLYELVHVQWLERATLVSSSGEGLGVSAYDVYRMD